MNVYVVTVDSTNRNYYTIANSFEEARTKSTEFFKEFNSFGQSLPIEIKGIEFLFGIDY